MRAFIITFLFTFIFTAPIAKAENKKVYLAKMQNWDESFLLRSPSSDFSHLTTEELKERKERKQEEQTSSSQSSVAAESKTEQTPAPSIERNWSGLYVGATLGTQFGKTSTKTGSFGYNSDNDEWKYKESGFNGGAEVGYNFVASNVVFGPELEIGYLNLRGNGAQPLAPGSDTISKVSSDFYTALRARIGADFSHNFVFASAGFMGINTKYEVTDNCEIAPCGGTTVSAQKKGLNWGYTFGGGVEHMFLGGWSIKLEYLYFGLGQKSLSGTTDLGDQYEWKSKSSGHIIRAGANISL